MKVTIMFNLQSSHLNTMKYQAKKEEIFNFRNPDCQQKFFEVTENTTKLSSCFNPVGDFLKQTTKFYKTLDGTFHQSFKKIRIKNKSNPNQQDEIQFFS